LPLFVELFLLGRNLFAQLGDLTRLRGALRHAQDGEEQGEGQARSSDLDELHIYSWNCMVR
jgi:hypothetical protein